MATQFTLEAMVRKFERRAVLDKSDRQALLALPYRVATYQPHAYLAREGGNHVTSCLLATGYSYRQKLTIDGARQILSVQIPGDFVDLESALLKTIDHNIQALTVCEVALIPHDAIHRLVAEHPKVAEALWVDTLIDASIFREWMANIGRRDGRTRMAHLLCEFARRLDVAGLRESYGYQLPMTQEQLADATGLTPVHVNRILRAMDKEGLIERNKRFVGIPSWKALSSVAGFNDRYLHIDQTTPGYEAGLDGR